MVTVCPLNRGPEQRTEKKPMVSDLYEFGSSEQDADMVILLHRPGAIERDDPRGGGADLILGEHRNGRTATITVAERLRVQVRGHRARLEPTVLTQHYSVRIAR
ncbi:DnaB-like helicase C-terminal domain-containing protein [Rhodococcus sp. IEGM 1381]|nr:DnaB-like helicase C-terminal domain-containing protein [Rhodococcus sp. IEGM 1381]MDI9893739.1 DnaB-like helicase C-terminal domain-containing protein [Rhodococcus sp. IEGM 1381]